VNGAFARNLMKTRSLLGGKIAGETYRPLYAMYEALGGAGTVDTVARVYSLLAKIYGDRFERPLFAPRV